MLEHILIKQFVNGLKNEVSRERVILKAPKTLTEVAQFARFSESAVRVARNHSAAPSSSSTVSSLGFRGRGSGSCPRGFASRGREQSGIRDNNFRGRGRNRSSVSEHSTRCHACQAVAQSTDRVNNKAHALSSDLTAKSWVTTRATAATARVTATVKVKEELIIGTSAKLKTVLIRTSSPGFRPSAPHPNKRSSKKKVR